MTKEHYISFVAAASSDNMQMVKLYPEGNAEARFKIRGVRRIFFYCNHDGLFSIDPVFFADSYYEGCRLRIVIISSLNRSRDTARKLFGERHFRKTELIDEVPLKSGFDSARKMPLWFWNVLGSAMGVQQFKTD